MGELNDFEQCCWAYCKGAARQGVDLTGRNWAEITEAHPWYGDEVRRGVAGLLREMREMAALIPRIQSDVTVEDLEKILEEAPGEIVTLSSGEITVRGADLQAMLDAILAQAPEDVRDD